jgi:hypothetical protein
MNRTVVHAAPRQTEIDEKANSESLVELRGRYPAE